MEQKELLKDLDYLYNALLRHPLLIDDPEKKEAFSQIYPQIQNGCTDLASFLSAASDLTAFFEDGHTNIELPYTENDLCLPIPCRWQDDVLLTTQPFSELPAGTPILGIEGKPILHILQQISRRIPHENLWLVKSRMTEYPYQNYHLFSQINLAWLFGSKEAYRVDFGPGEHVVSVDTPLLPYSGFLNFPDKEDHVSWHIRDGAALLRLDACICDKQYIQTLQELAAACNAQNATSLTLDLSRNMGGSSAVIDPFLQHVDVDSFHRFEMIDYSSGSPTDHMQPQCDDPKPESRSPFPEKTVLQRWQQHVQQRQDLCCHPER